MEKMFLLILYSLFYSKYKKYNDTNNARGTLYVIKKKKEKIKAKHYFKDNIQ